MQNQSSIIFRVIQLAAVAVFAGRAYQHLFWDAPYREIFWDPFYMQGLIEQFTSLSWEEYVTHPDGDVWFQKFIFGQGIFYTLCALIAVFIKQLPKWCRWILIAGAVNLMILAMIYMKDKFYHFGQFLEYSLQFGTPLFLIYFLQKDGLSRRLVFWMQIAAALTFACHGLYAVGYYTRPGSFMSMTQAILGMDRAGVDSFLLLAGFFDFFFAIALLPSRGNFRKVLLWYAVMWGMATSFARIFGNFYWDFPIESLHQWTYAVVFRFPHFLIPLVLLLSITEFESIEKGQPESKRKPAGVLHEADQMGV